MNLYIQPQDPQMQIQPMTWVPFALASVFAVTSGMRSAASWVPGGLVAATLLLAGLNLNHYVPQRHSDSIAQANVRAVEAMTMRERTVFLFQGFESMNTWLTAAWGPGTEQPTPGGPEIGRYNVIYLVSEATEYPNRSAGESAESVASLVERALDEGFDVVTGDVWNRRESDWISDFGTVSSAEKPLAIRRALHERFDVTRIGAIPGWTVLYKVSRKDGTRSASQVGA